MPPARLSGVLAPVVSTFDADDGELSRRPFQSNLHAYIDAGLHGVVVGGSTGEAPLLDDEELATLVEWARQVVPQDCWLIAGTGGEPTHRVIVRNAEVMERGADAVLVLPPHYYTNAMTTEAIAAHYERVADESPLPILLYNMPKYTHLTLDPAMVRALAEHENIIGMKDSSGDPSLLARYLEAQSPAFRVLTGNGRTFCAAMEAGASGGILAIACFAPELTLDVHDQACAGDVAGARGAQERLAPLATDVVGQLEVAGVKAAMDQVGLYGGAVRPPLLPLTAAGRERIGTLLRRAELAPA